MVDQAIAAPVSLLGVIVMVLLAYTIFTTTLVLQRKQAARGLALGLASLTIPAVALLAISPVHPATPFFVAAFGVLLFRGLLRPEVRAYLSEPWPVGRATESRRDGTLTRTRPPSPPDAGIPATHRPHRGTTS